ncbi:PREDICTED: uncharacterized protein LOC105556537 [Vollenhovia emeryi]|uniref:uncharacterized protein LOC105556537 n=1 Tax=Vollenhovia emeryi TaxID=411798 RepID=UPI0005F39F06|nr:PREDICTED: uncharacterized protein LOC105556537 [Vollenhovia emeryi]
MTSYNLLLDTIFVTIILCRSCKTFFISVFIMASNVEDAILAAAACVILTRQHIRTKRRFWVRPSLEARKKYSGTILIADLERDDRDILTGEIRCDGSFKNFARMTSFDFEYLINKIGHKIGRKDTTFRNAIPVRERLAVTLRFLASGDSYQSLSFLFKISKQSISNIVPEVCEALIDFLKDQIKVSI